MINATNNRQAEFLAGRYAAHNVLKKIGIIVENIPIGFHRSPIWPPNIVASISHSKSVAICAASLSINYDYLGIDIENWINRATAHNIKDIIITKAEEKYIEEIGISFDKALTMIYSAKESLFKAIHCYIGTYFDFDVVEVSLICLNKKIIILTLIKKLSSKFDIGRKFKFNFIIDEASVITFVSGRL